MIVLMIASFVSKHITLINDGKVSGQIYAKAALENIWRTIPFLDTQSYIQFSERCGLPIVQDSDQFAPSGNTFDSLIRIDREDDGNNSPSVIQLARSAVFISQVANALGIPSRVLFTKSPEWYEAVNRSISILRGNPNNLLNNME